MARRSDDLRARLLATFRPEAREHLEAIGGRLLVLEQGLADEPARTAVEEAFRAFHTLKGAARSVGLMELERLAQACEAVFNRVTRGLERLTPARLKTLRETVVAIGKSVEGQPIGAEVPALVARLEGAPREAAPGRAHAAPAEPHPQAAPASAEGPRPPPKGAVPPETLRVSTARLDALLLQVEELLAAKLAADERARQARGLVDALDSAALSAARLGAGCPAGSPGREQAKSLEADLKAAAVQAAGLASHLRRDDRALAAGVDNLQSAARGLRMSPTAAILTAFPGMVRDLADSQGKQVEWIAEGTTVEIDRKVAEAVKDPLLHLVRNAVDHGIEPSDARVRAGKPPRGSVALRIRAVEGGRIEFSVSDDGAGIDPEQVKAAAVRLRQLAPRQATELAREDALALVFRSGVSTAPVITALSGHGLGLAIVRERVERLGGRVGLEATPGRGTTVRLEVPASIATFCGLLVLASGRPFLLSIDAVERVVRVARDQVRQVEGRDTCFLDGRAVPLAPLSALLGLPETERSNGSLPCVVISGGAERAALHVDEVSGDREVVVKELRPPLLRVRHVAGAGLLASGELALILRHADLVRACYEPRRAATPAPEPERPARVLVVDDSITTRTMEKNLLEAAGYQVQVAVDGVDAWTALKSQPFDIVVSDVDMPRMDGFELTRRVRADRELAGLPVVLVTALESRDDKERGIEVGANAYVVKSSFDQSNLLEILRRLA